MSVQASPEQSRKIASLALLGSIVWALVAAITAWLIWGTAIAVLVAVASRASLSSWWASLSWPSR